MTFVVQTSRVLAAILIAGALSALVEGTSTTEAQEAVSGSAKAAKLTQCVRPTEFMRRNHMELIKHQRDITVHEGIRDTRYSLAGCVACHVQYDNSGHAVPINARQQFCSRCHEWVAVRLDCFQCHSPVPQGSQPTNLMLNWPHVFSPASINTQSVLQVKAAIQVQRPAKIEQPIKVERPITTGQPMKTELPTQAAPPVKAEQPVKPNQPGQKEGNKT